MHISVGLMHKSNLFSDINWPFFSEILHLKADLSLGNIHNALTKYTSLTTVYPLNREYLCFLTPKGEGGYMLI